jgi:hypothetical protein
MNSIRTLGDFRRNHNIASCRSDGSEGPNRVVSLKLMVIERHRDVLVADRKSINYVGYEEGLLDYLEEGKPASVESEMNQMIETPFSSSPTWSKIKAGACDSLSDRDKLPIYMFARHLQRRNRETLRFIETENAPVQAEGFAADFSEEECDIYRWIAASTGGAHALFRDDALNMMLPADAGGINVIVCRSPGKILDAVSDLWC